MTHLFLGRRTAALAEGVWTEISNDPEAGMPSPEDVVRAAWKLLPRPRRPRVSASLSIWLSAAWARPFVVSAMPGLRSWAEVLSWAQAECKLHVGAAWRDNAAVWIDRWSELDGSLATAADPALLGSVQAMARSTGWHLRSIRPWWAAPGVLRSDIAGVEALFAPCPDGVTWLVGDDARIFAAGAWVPAPTEASMPSMRRRLLLLHPGVEVRECQWAADWLDRR